MTHWQQCRQVLIAIAFASVCLTLVRFSLDPTAGKRPVTPFAFPAVVPLPGWQLSNSHPLPIPATPPDSLDSVLASRKYHYRQQGQQLEIEMRYIGGTLGDIHGYFTGYTAIQLTTAQLYQNLRQQSGVGVYSLFIAQGRSHLSACINPRGGSTVDYTQFLANRHIYDFHPQRLVLWLLGQESLRDRRCLWADLSIPLGQGAETNYPVLEQAWLSWYRWWSPRFPGH